MNRLSDFVSNAGLSAYAEIALVIFFLAFLGICVYLMVRKKESWEPMRHLPLDDDDAPPRREHELPSPRPEDRR